jgi:hypothetical protein
VRGGTVTKGCAAVGIVAVLLVACAKPRPLRPEPPTPAEERARLDHQVTFLRQVLEAHIRVRRIGLRLLRAIRGQDPGAPSMGYVLAPIVPAVAQLFDTPPGAQGLVVTYVDEDGPAAQAVFPGDVLTAVDDRAVTDVRTAYPDDLATGAHRLTLLRGGQRHDVTITAEHLALSVAFLAEPVDRATLRSDRNQIAVSTKMLALLSDDAELAGIIAHQLAHLVDRDAVQLPGYTPDQERLADRLAVEFMAQAGYDPTALSRALDRLGQQPASLVTPFWTTHPAFSARAAEALSAAADLMRHDPRPGAPVIPR